MTNDTPPTMIKLTDHDGDAVIFEIVNDKIHIQTLNTDGDLNEGPITSIDKAAARKLIYWLTDTIGPSAYYSTPTIVELEE